MTLFAVVEIMGHRQRAGVISDATIGGAAMLRIEHPTVADHTGEEPLTEYYAPSAIFAIRPCSQDDAIKFAESYWRGKVADRPALAPALEELIDVDVEDEDEAW